MKETNPIFMLHKEIAVDNSIQYSQEFVVQDSNNGGQQIRNVSKNAFQFKFNINMSEIELIGCDFDYLKIYISKLLRNDMTFTNYGEWELDHIFPISKINYLDNNEIKKYFQYKNLQPLWKTENRHKYNKTECEHSELGEANGEIIENNFVVL